MADHLTRLCQFLAEEKLSSSSSSLDLLRKIRSDESIKLGLQQLYLILQAGLDTIEPGSHPRFKLWSDNQILSLASLGSCITVFQSLSVEQLEPIIVAVARKLVEFTVSFLEKSDFSGDDLSLQSNMIQILEIILGGGTDKIVDFSQPASVNSLVDLLPIVSSNLDGIELDESIKCCLQGIKCPRAEKQVDRLLLALASECVQPERNASGFEAPTFHHDLNSLIFLSQHWAVAHAECIRSLILLCKELVDFPYIFDERIAGTNLRKRLSFSLRILKSLGCLVKDVAYVEYNSSMLEAVASFADLLPNLFRHSFEFVNNTAATEGNFESLALSLVEEFIHLVRVIFCNSVIFQNVQACIAASILEHLGPSIWRYNKAALNIKAPLAYFPRTVIYTLKLIQDLRIQLNEVVDLKELSTELGGCVDLSNDSPSCCLRVQKIPLLKRFAVDELSRMIFPSSSKWMDNLMHLFSFLHSEGMKLKPKMENSTSSGRSNCSSELENAVCHDDEALFGNLFSEGSRMLGSGDACDQTSAVSSSSSNCNMPMQAATALLSFLKGCIFSHEWLPFVFEDACKMLSADHIDILLYILSCQGCHFEDNFAAAHEDRKSGHIQELSFQLLHNLLTQHALSGSLEDYLVVRILNVEDGTFVYNDQTLTLLAHALFSRVGLAGSQLRTKIYRGFVSFIVEKARSICSDCPNLKELLVTLPSVFHIEILLMAFHLSPDEDKATMANFMFSAFRTADVPSPGSYGMKLSCWALVVSRLILVLRHMILHPRACPPSLLLAFRSKMRDTQCFDSHVPTNSFDDFSSLASIAAKDLTGALVDEEPSSSSLFHQLIDTAYLQSPLCIDDVSIGSLRLSWDDLCSSFSYLMGLWNGKKAATMEDLIIERYIFLLCWDMPCMKSPLDHQLSQGSNLQTMEISSIEHFFRFSHSLLGQCNVIGNGADFQNLVVGLLRRLHGANMQDNFESLGWDFLRKEMWMSLILSFFNVGIERYCVKNIPWGGQFWIENRPGDSVYSNSAEGFISCLISDGHISELLRMFASFLKGYLQTYEKAFLATLGDSQHDDCMFSPVLLLKLSTFDKFLWDKLLKKCGVDSCQLESVLDILLKVDGAVEKRASGILAKVFWECMLHGFPSHLQTSSGILLSCILNIRGIIFTLDGLLKLAKLKGNIFLEIDVQHQILDSLTSVKLDRILERLHGKCDDVCLNLNAGLELSDYTELFLLKHMEGFLRCIHSGELGDTSILEWVITKTIDTMDALRKDPKKSTVFKFYLGAEDMSEPCKELHGSKRGDIMVLIDSVANCHTESVNIKVLSFLVDLLSGEICPNLKLKIQTKFLSMDLVLLSKWLEKRLLGYTAEAMDGVKSVKANSVSLRESTMSFILCLVSSQSELQSKLYNHLFEAVLISLETSFLQFDIHTAKSYFHFVVQLARGENSMKWLLKRTIMLMQKLADDERLLPGLKFIFGFLGCFLSDCGSPGNTTEKCSGKSPSVSSVAVGPVASKPLGSRKNSDVLVLSANRDGASAALECDATSVDEDEDDGTSDGEEASIDKEEEEDTNSERALASKVCTFTSSGSNFMEQHWYFCYTCDLTVSKGCCSVCAKVCHRGHRVVYSRSSRFFCDCGAGGVRGSSCQCLKPRKFTGTDSALNCGANNFQSFLPLTEDADQLPESDSDVDEDVGADIENSLRLSIPKDLQDGISMLIEELDVESQVLELFSALLPSITSRRESNISKDKKIFLGKDKVLAYGMDLLQLKKAYKSGSLDLKIKTDYSNGKELKMHLASGSLVKSLLSVSIRGRLAVGEGDKVTIFDVGQLIGQATIAPVTADKANLKALSKNLVRFEIVLLAFNHVVENYLAVAGYEDCQVLTLNPRGEVTDRLAIELALQGAYIRRIEWVPGSQVQLMVVTNRFVKIYDLSQDNISPMHYFTLPDDTIVDATLFVASQGRMFLVVLSERGSLFKLGLSLEGHVGVTPLKEIIHIQDREIHAKGSSLYFSCTYKLLFLSYQDGTTLIGRLSPDATSLIEISGVYEKEQDGMLRPAGLHRWKDTNELFAQNLRHAVSSSSPLVGITAYKPLSKDKVHCLVLHDDGSLQIYSHVPMGVDAAASATAEKVKKLGSNILNNKAYAGTKPEFPLDFFEKTVCITADLKLGGDAIRNGDFEGAKQSLASEDGFLESPSPAGFKISVSNSNPDIVMVGFRVYVGNQSANHIPSEITIFQRVIKLDEGMRSWYDIPFTVAESLLSDEEFIISVGPTFSGTSLPRIDSLEVYGRPKDEFGWKEKMDAVLDIEARVLGANSVLAGSSKKSRSMQSAPIQEQVVAGGLKLLSRIYSLCRRQEEELKVDLSKLKSKQLLEAIFESDREPLMLAAACRVLQAVFPKKDIYYQIKDAMRLLGVVKSTSVLSSMLGIGGATGRWLIEEFTAQMRAVSKIALHRRSNLASFLEINGSEVVDGLMQVLWGILDLELPDTQTMNNIVMSAVELIYSYAECLALQGKDTGRRPVAPAVILFKKLLFFPNEAVQTSSSLAISSRLLQVPFPKQTMLGTDDVVESAVTISVPADTSGGNSQVMIEEDSITSSVQYSCDGCSTVPILRRRWHCTVCPDFDLCEACYEVLDADRLPPPHSRDHPMTAIPIEVESLGGDGSEIRFSTDDLSDANLVANVTDVGMQTSAPSIHVLEPSESMEFSSSMTDPVSISASKRAVNSLLLSELLEQLKGWMETTSGIRAIPVMQLFYRLSSAVGGPFIDSSKKRSSFGEVAILVFMFFTLMLRNWHQPGSDGTASKGTGNTDSPEKVFLKSPLVHVFKSPAAGLENAHGSNVASGCGALLTIRRDLPAGNFSPFFSDSYAKAHRADTFMDYHRLLLENAFRLVYTLVRPEKHDKNGEKDKVYKASSGKDLKLDGYQEVLCSYINNPHTTFVRRYARRLFLHLCGSKTHYYSVRDSWQFSTEVKKLYKHVNKSGGFQNPVPYERSVKIVKCFSTIAEVAAARPRNWQKYCLRHSDVLPFLMNGIFYFGEESVIQTLKLLNLAFYLGKDMNHSLQKAESGDSGTISNRTGGDVLRQFIDCFLLEWNSSSVRAESKCVLYGVWHHGKHSFKETVLAALLQKVKCLPMYGQNIVEYTELITWLLGEFPDKSSKQQTEIVDHCLTPDVIRSIFEALHSQNELIANHPNSRIYNTLSGLVEFDGYYLESEPCVACSSPEVPFSRMKLESLKSETKFTDNRIIVKCTGSYTIQTVTMNVHDARKSKSVNVLNLYYNNRPVADLSELKNNWSLWKRAKSCHLAFNQSELKVEFPIPITACNFMIELDSFYENLQALSLEPLQCPRCSRPVTDKHGICSNCHENAYQCRQCRNINYENLDSFLCNECGYSKYGRFEFNFMAKPSFTFDNMENDEDMKKGLAAIEAESENAHRRYQQLLGFKKPLLKIVSSIGENEMDSQQKDSVQQMMVSLPGPSCKINRKIALLGVLYGEKCKAAFDSVSKSVQTLQGLRRVLMNYLHQKHSDNSGVASRFVISRSPNNCYGCAMTFVTQCLEILQVLSKHQNSKKQLVSSGILSELFENNIHQGPKTARVQTRAALCAFSEGDVNAVSELNSLIQKKVMYCLEHHRSMDIAVASREELLLLSEVCSLADEFWESRLRVVFHLLFSSIKLGAKHPAISEHIVLPCLRIISLACTPPKPDTAEKEQGVGKSNPVMQQKDENNSTIFGSHGGGISSSKLMPEPMEKNWVASHKTQDIQLLSYSEWEKGASYLDFVRRQYKVSQTVKGMGPRSRPHRTDFLALKYGLRWKRSACKANKGDLSVFELGSWVTELVLSACSQSIRSEMCMLISLLCAQSPSRRFRLLNLLMGLLPSTLAAGESAAEYFELLFKMIESEDARLFLTVRGCLDTICKLITKEVGNIESLERSLHIDISQGFILHKLIELLGKFLEVPNIRSRFMQDNLLTEVLEALIVIRGLIVQKTKLISDCNRLLKDLLDSLLLESSENKRQFIRACICGLQIHGEEKKGRTCLFILEQLCNLICPSKPEATYLLVLNKAHTQEEFIRGSMTKNPYSSAEIGPLMRDVKNKICHQLDLIGLLEDDYGMELLVAGNIISLDLSIAQVYEQVWKKSNSQSSNSLSNSSLLSSGAVTSSRECSPMIVTYRLQGLDGEATEPMIKELEEDREESQDPEVEFAIAGAVREYDGLETLLRMIQRLRDDFKSNQEQLVAVLNLLMHCCKIRENRRALLRLGALGLLLETARRAFTVDAMEPAEWILLIVESLTIEANESDTISISQSVLTVTSEETGTGDQAKKIVLMFLERLSHPPGHKKSNKQQRNTEMVARILPYLTYGEPDAMEALIQHFNPYLQDWGEFDRLQKQHQDDPKDETIALQAAKQRFTVENFVMVSESLKTSSCGERLKDIILEKGITGVAVRHLSESFAIAGQAGFKSSSEWALALKLPSVPLVLSMLRGLSMGHFATQRCIDESGILPLVHALEGVPGENEIGAKAENLLDTLSDKESKGDGFLEEKVRKLRHATRDEMRRRALRKREELLQGLGMRQELASDGGERIVVSRPLLEGLEDVEEEEDGLACMVCREGYSLRPTDLLGVYSYSKRVNLVPSGGQRADAALRNPKKEWEGATLRNNESLCNSLFPVRGPSVPLALYVRCVDQYWDNLNALGRADGSRLRLLTYDIVLMLARFATGASFSAECRGGGRESNSRFLPFMIQMARHLLEQGGPSQRRNMAKAIATYISSSSLDSKSATSGTEETVQFMMVNSLLSEPYESWLQHRRDFLQRGIYHAYMQHTHGRSTAKIEPASISKSLTSTESSGDELLSIVRPMLVYTGLIEQLQQIFKVKKSSSMATVKGKAEGTSTGTEGEGLEGWEVVMKERLLNVKEMLGFSKELLSWLDDMNSASDLQEAFDIIGALGDVLSGGFTRCEDFVQAAIAAGKM
ncbi:Auxin transport protein BIG [Hibiscus syriacus]|uniref:Auxin transport protein BIG n=1 Tax=Hibiscus syriacus TaxID=106335 RepID=A0A6A2Z3U1_HIBSY|nr:Auxin transport protein BIG [Hibiscus syriacus]